MNSTDDTGSSKSTPSVGTPYHWLSKWRFTSHLRNHRSESPEARKQRRKVKALKPARRKPDKPTMKYLLLTALIGMATGCATGTMTQQQYDAQADGIINALGGWNQMQQQRQPAQAAPSQHCEQRPVYIYGQLHHVEMDCR